MIAKTRGRQQAKSENSNAPLEAVHVPIEQLVPNSWNPNEMTEEEFSEFVTEVRHLGRVPKPIIARQDGDKFLIVDGEHGWRAAKEAGFTTVPIEIIDVDDFEAKRQTYKRNQHGTHNPVLLGQMFQQMLDDRGISRRELADAIQVSEGTIRNMLLYAQAADLRNRYAQPAVSKNKAHWIEQYRRDISDLSVAEVRRYVELPSPVRDMWLDCGADKSVLWLPWDRSFEPLEDDHDCADAEFDNLVGYYEELVSSGVIAFLKETPGAPKGFARDMRKLVQWEYFNRKFECKGVTLAEIRQYTKHFLWGVWHVRDKMTMSWALNKVLQPAKRNGDGGIDPGQFLLTPDEFDQVIEQTRNEPSSSVDFDRRLELAVIRKHGPRPDTNDSVEMELLELRIQEEAPEFIRNADFHPHLKEALWKAAGSDESKRQFIANDDRVYASKRQSLRDAVASRLEWIQRCSDAKSAYDNQTAEQHGQTIAERFYDPKESPEPCRDLAAKLESVFTREELVTFEMALKHNDEMRQMLHDLMERIGGGGLVGDEPA